MLRVTPKVALLGMYMMSPLERSRRHHACAQCSRARDKVCHCFVLDYGLRGGLVHSRYLKKNGPRSVMTQARPKASSDVDRRVPSLFKEWSARKAPKLGIVDFFKTFFQYTRIQRSTCRLETKNSFGSFNFIEQTDESSLHGQFKLMVAVTRVLNQKQLA